MGLGKKEGSWLTAKEVGAFLAKWCRPLDLHKAIEPKYTKIARLEGAL